MKHSKVITVPSVLAGLTALALCGCSSPASTPPPSGSGGATTTASGGTTDTGGTTESGGVEGSGGAVGSGGEGSGGVGSGGVGSGGTTSEGAGGAVAGTGGRNLGGRTGRSRTGGSSGGGGLSTAGATGSPGGSGGTTPPTPSGDPIPSSGCSATPTTTSACTNTASSPCTIDVKGTTREYYLNLPSGYDGTKPVPVVWEYHPMGGNAKQGITMYGLNSKLTNVIFVSPQGLGSTPGFPNTGGQDENMTRAINDEIEAKYCTDKARYFATGFSYGGSMSFTAACNMSDIFRAIGAMSGSTVSGATCARTKPARMVAIWATHGDADTVLPISAAQSMIEALAKDNGCTTTTQPVDPSPCVAYQGCQEGYPVIWCVRPGDGHGIPSFGGSAIAAFFQQYF